jgi:hypothetical protein
MLIFLATSSCDYICICYQIWVVVFLVSFHSFSKCVVNMDTIDKVLLCETRALYKLIVSCVTRLVQNIIENWN